MAEIVKKATRESFGEALVELGKENRDIVVLVADLADATKVENFGKAYPDRFIECGIAEGNMIGVAAGLASCGKIPFATSFAMLSPSECEDSWLPRRHIRGRRRRHPSVLRGYRPYAHHPRHGGAEPCRPL